MHFLITTIIYYHNISFIGLKLVLRGDYYYFCLIIKDKNERNPEGLIRYENNSTSCPHGTLRNLTKIKEAPPLTRRVYHLYRSLRCYYLPNYLSIRCADPPDSLDWICAGKTGTWQYYQIGMSRNDSTTKASSGMSKQKQFFFYKIISLHALEK